MIERIFKNWKTSVIGFIGIFASLIFIGTHRATMVEGMSFLTGFLLLFFVKDPKMIK